jgi:hypothetical protein
MAAFYQNLAFTVKNIAFPALHQHIPVKIGNINYE